MLYQAAFLVVLLAEIYMISKVNVKNQKPDLTLK